MEFQVNTNQVILRQQDQVESGEYNVTECNFIFSSEFDGLTKKAVFTGEDGTAYLQTIIDNKCSIPSEILEVSQVVEIGVYAYDVENEELVLRYSPEPTQFYIHQGSYKEAQNSTPPTPSEIEQLQAQITSNKNDIEEMQGDIVDINSDIVDIKAEQITQNENIQTNANNISTITENITIINEALGTINENIGDLQEGQIEQNINIQKNADDIIEINQDINEIDSSINAINQNIDDLEQDLTNYSLITETGSQINLNINSSNFQMTAILKDKNGNVIHTSNVIDLPLETMVVGASYDNVTKEVVLTLQNGTTLRFSVADLVSGLVSETQLQTILANYYTKTEVDNLLSEKANQSSLDTTNQNLTNLAGRVSTNETDIADIKEEQITQNTNIEELQNQVETLQEDLDNANSEIAELNTDITNMAKAMYKVEGQGSDITLQNTSENKFVELGLEGRTEQDGEPTPENPVPIKNVTGNANVKIQNKNLAWNGWAEDFVSRINNSSLASIVTKDGKRCLKFDRTAGYGNYDTKYLFKTNWKENTQYTLSCDLFAEGSGSFANIQIRYTDGTISDHRYDRTENNWKKYTLVSTENKTVTDITVCYLSGINYIDLDTFMVEQSPTATSYVEHQEQNLPFTLKGKNLYDDNAPITEYYINNQGQFVKGTNNDAFIETFIDKNIAEDYVTSFTRVVGISYVRFAFFNGDNLISRVLLTESNTYVHTPPNTTKIYIHTDKRDIKYFEDLQIEAGTIATEYEPFYDIKAMQGTTLEDDGIHQKRKQKIFDGTENWLAYGSTDNYIGVQVLLGDNIENNIGLCNYFINNKTIVYSRNGNAMWLDYNGGQGIIRISISKEIAQSVQEFKQWLATKYANGTPVIVEYELAESELENNIIPYNETQQAQYNNIKANASSYDDITIISSESDELGFDMKAIAVADANKVIDNQNNEIDTIKSRLDLLEG